MAEAALAIAGLAIGAPGVVSELLKYGEWLYDRAGAVKHSNEIWKELAKIGESLSRGQFKLYVERANEAYVTPGLERSLKNSLADQIQRLELDLYKAQSILEQQEPKGLIGKTRFAFAGERKIDGALKVLRPHEQGLFQLIMLINISKPSIDRKILLSKDRFAVDEGKGYLPVSFTSGLFLASATYKETATDMEKEELSVLMERQEDAKTVAEEDIKEITNFLAYRLPDDAPHPGVLMCLGYRMTPEPELVFKLSEDVQAQTLQTLIAADIGKDYGGGHPLDYRLRLARQVSQAVLTVHKAGLVHKNIRTETILVLKPLGALQNEATRNKVGFGDPYLTEWRLLRDANAPSVRRPPTPKWWQNIYRHPERQRLGPQKYYNMGHDIYSLGVCLLEIGLWDALVRTRTADGQPVVSELFKKGAMVSEFATPEEVQGILNDAPSVKAILVSLALRYLPSRTGFTYTWLVVACLKVLDSPSGLSEDIPDFSELNDTEKGLAFNNLILSSFPSESF